MPSIPVDDATWQAFQARLAALGPGASADALLRSMLAAAPEPHALPPVPLAPVAAHVAGTSFRALPLAAERYLALLALLHEHHPREFRDYVEAQSRRPRRSLLSPSPEAIRERSRHNQASPVAGSPFWAVMNLDHATKERFLGRLMAFIGYPEETIRVATDALVPGRGR